MGMDRQGIQGCIGRGGLSLAVILIQYVMGTGLCELDDLMHNTFGAFVGYQMFLVFLQACFCCFGTNRIGQVLFIALVCGILCVGDLCVKTA